MGDLVKAVDRIEDEYAHNSSGFASYLWTHLPWDLRKTIGQLSGKEREYGYDPISARVEEYKRVGQMQNITLELLRHARDGISPYKNWQKDIARFMKHYSEVVLKEKEFENLIDMVEETDQIKTIEEAKDKFRAVKEYIQFAKELDRELAAFKERENIISSRHDRGGQKYPAHGKTETLYHATPFVREILAQGFKTKKEIGREVLGGATNGISFTADKRIAKEIGHALQDVIKIARKQITLKDVIMMMKRESIPIKGSQWAQDYWWFAQKKNKASSWAGRQAFDPQNSVYDRDEHYVFDLYKHYLMSTKLRYNPLFFGVRIDQFGDLDPDNVGVIAARVDMEQVVEYLPSMEEFRVPVKAILDYRQI